MTKSEEQKTVSEFILTMRQKIVDVYCVPFEFLWRHGFKQEDSVQEVRDGKK